MKKHTKKLLALALAFTMLLGIISTTTAATGKKALNATYKNISITLNGKKITLKDVNGKTVEPFLIDGTTYVPVRAVSEALGLDVDWNGKDNTVVLKNTPVKIQKVVANCTSEPYGKAIQSFTFYVNSTAGITDLTTDDFTCTHLVYDGNEVHKPFDSKALGITFTNNTVTVEVSPFYPDMSFTRAGYWSMTCTNPIFNVNPATELTYSDPVVEAFDNFTVNYGTGKDAATLDCYLYTPDNANGPLPIVIFNSGGTGVSVTGDLYGANFAVSFAKETAQAGHPCYILYPQRNSGSTENLIDGIKSTVDKLVAEGKVDANRIYMTGESAGTSFTVNFIDRHPGWNTAIAIFAGGGMTDECIAKQVKADTKIMFVPCLGDTTAKPEYIAPTYKKLVELGMEPGVEVVWHYYTANDFNALLNDNTYWEFVQDAEYVTCPVYGDMVKTYMYPEGKLHNNSYPGANDTYIKNWLFNQSKVEFTAQRSENYSASHNAKTVDYSIIPEKYTLVAHLEDVPGVPAGTSGPMTVYTNETKDFFYLEFKLNPPLNMMHTDPQYVECVVVGNTSRVIMDCSGTWWTADINNATMPYLMSIIDTIQWQPYSR